MYLPILHKTSQFSIVVHVEGIMTDSADKKSEGNSDQDWRMSSGMRWLQQAPDKGSIPQGAVRVHKNEVAAMMNQVIENWKPKREM